MIAKQQYGLDNGGNVTTNRGEVEVVDGHVTMYSLREDGRWTHHVYGPGGAEGWCSEIDVPGAVRERILQDAEDDGCASFADACNWARHVAAAGDYLVRYVDSGRDAESDPGSRCGYGYGDDELAELDRILWPRDLRLVADDLGLIVMADET